MKCSAIFGESKSVFVGSLQASISNDFMELIHNKDNQSLSKDSSFFILSIDFINLSCSLSLRLVCLT